MGGASRAPSRTKSVGFPIGDKAKGPFNDIAEQIVKGLLAQWKREQENHGAHVEAFRKHMEWVNRPWTWKNRLAALINWIFGNR